MIKPPTKKPFPSVQKISRGIVTLPVSIREKPGVAFYARCCSKTASCTSDYPTAARKAAAKHVASCVALGLWPVAIRPERITLKKTYEGFTAVVPAPVSGQCFGCGCIDRDCRGCIERTGEPCHWVNDEHTVCSACLSGESAPPARALNPRRPIDRSARAVALMILAVLLTLAARASTLWIR